MTVQTIPDIDAMTPAQQIEPVEAPWKSMSEQKVNSEPPEWHLNHLEDRERAVAESEDSFIGLDEFEEGLLNEYATLLDHSAKESSLRRI